MRQFGVVRLAKDGSSLDNAAQSWQSSPLGPYPQSRGHLHAVVHISKDIFLASLKALPDSESVLLAVRAESPAKLTDPDSESSERPAVSRELVDLVILGDLAAAANRRVVRDSVG